MRAYVEGVGLIGPGLNGWSASRSVLAGEAPYRESPVAVAASSLLPPAERRRAGLPVRLALAAGQEAFAEAGRDLSVTATVFASSGGDCDNVHQLCEALATPERQVSPTVFHNSVHNVAAGYWGIATKSRAPSTSLCAYDASVAAGLLEAACQVAVEGTPLALIVHDQPYPEPLRSVRPISAPFGAALVLAPQRTERAIAEIEVAFVPERAEATPMRDAGLESLRRGVPAARGLALLATLARGASETIVLDGVEGTHLRVEVTPCG